jgi:hypothetical protein
MHLNNGGINRPSLLSGGEQAKAQTPNSGRILADMEGRQVPASSRAQSTRVHVGPRRRWPLIAGIAIVATALLAWVLISVGTQTDRDDYSLTPESHAPSGHPVAPVASPNDGAAMIVNADDAAPAQGNPLDALSTDSTASTAAAPAGPATGAPATRQATPARRAQGAAGAGTKNKSDENLLGTLLGIIKEDEKTKPAAQQPRTMDDLIAKIEADQQQHAEDERTAFDQVASKKSASTESSIQAQLRRCPGANTMQGLECRRRVCANVTGKDPACPAM